MPQTSKDPLFVEMAEVEVLMASLAPAERERVQSYLQELQQRAETLHAEQATEQVVFQAEVRHLAAEAGVSLPQHA